MLAVTDNPVLLVREDQPAPLEPLDLLDKPEKEEPVENKGPVVRLENPARPVAPDAPVRLDVTASVAQQDPLDPLDRLVTEEATDSPDPTDQPESRDSVESPDRPDLLVHPEHRASGDRQDPLVCPARTGVLERLEDVDLTDNPGNEEQPEGLEHQVGGPMCSSILSD